uniref:O-fucosyltransferase family protein n=1 Tax=Chenopodium quinoa TaxID=63459 RepID=A0A803M672_CHEQI
MESSSVDKDEWVIGEKRMEKFHRTLVITATVCCWMMWAIVYLAQMKPLINPILNEAEATKSDKSSGAAEGEWNKVDIGKSPFLWHDHLPVKDYAKIRSVGGEAIGEQLAPELGQGASGVRSKLQPMPYMAVHMKIEKEWMIHCKKLEQRSNINEICSSKEEIIERVGYIKKLSTPTVFYLVVADSLLEDKTILNGWQEGLLPFQKKKLASWYIDEVTKGMLFPASGNLQLLTVDLKLFSENYDNLGKLENLERLGYSTLKQIIPDLASTTDSNTRKSSLRDMLLLEYQFAIYFCLPRDKETISLIGAGNSHFSRCSQVYHCLDRTGNHSTLKLQLTGLHGTANSDTSIQGGVLCSCQPTEDRL